ncbi:MAG: cation transporter [Burkholderiales bacterium]
MSQHCHAHAPDASHPAYRRALVVALVLNAAMFAVELATGVTSGSSALLADALDFAGDAGNYALSLGALALMPALRPKVALFKGLCMGAFGLLVLGATGWHAARGTVPGAAAMSTVAVLALAVNAGVAVLLYRFRAGDADMRSVWLCSRNDALGNVAVLLAAAGVFGTASGWPDWLVAAAMAGLALSASWSVVRHARREILDAACESESSPDARTAR